MTAGRRPLALLLFVLGCGGPEPAAPPAPPAVAVFEPAVPPEEPIVATEADRRAVADGNRRFAVDLYKQLAAKPGSLVIAPDSVSEALAMTYAGARGDTAAEMAKALHFSLPPDRLHTAFGATRQEFTAAAGPFELNVANALFGRGGFVPEPEFQALARRFYAARLGQVPHDRVAAVKEINGWVASHTRDKITDLLKPDDLDQGNPTKFFLCNAVYFRGDWATPFDPTRTRSEPFAVSPVESADVPMMSLGGVRLRHHAGPAFDLLELPYAGDRLAMLVLVPKERHGLAAVEANLTADQLADAVAGLRPAECNVWLPRFTVRTRRELREPLESLGMRRAFTRGADFAGISLDLWVSKVVHGGLIEADERGTTAAGATVVIMNGRGGSVRPPVTVRADHPFLFLIHDRPTGAVLFLGRYAGPT